jgi:hypothetical protein
MLAACIMLVDVYENGLHTSGVDFFLAKGGPSGLIRFHSAEIVVVFNV